MTQWKVFVRESRYLNVGYLRISTFGVWLTVFPELQLAMLEQKQLTAPSSSQTEPRAYHQIGVTSGITYLSLLIKQLSFSESSFLCNKTKLDVYNNLYNYSHYVL